MTRVSKFGWCALLILVLAPWGAVLWLYRTTHPAPQADSAPKATVAAAPAPSTPSKPVTLESARLRPGPWGHIESATIVIEPPEEFIPSDYRPEPPRWVFKNTSAAQLQKLWDEAQLPPAQRAVVEDPARRVVEGADIIVSPGPELVLALSPESRAIVYTALAASLDNPAQREPFRYRGESLDEWFVDSDLPSDVVELTRKLIYQRNDTAFFSDYDLVLPRIPDIRTRTLYLKTLARKSAYVLALRVERDTDIEALADYWGRGRRAKDVKPLLQSIARQPDLNTLDVVHLIPRFARSLLYTFPLPSDDPNSVNRDCHWTSFNFYSEEPDDRFTDIEFVKRTLMNDYYPVAGPAQLGDVIMFVQPGGVVVHSCVFIADDIVFTKNGPSFAVPWQFAKLDRVVSFYSVGNQPIELRRYRSKNQ